MGVDSIVQAVDVFYGRISAKESVPAGKNITVVGIGKGLGEVVMDFMHIGRNYYPPQGLVQFFRQGDIGVVELGAAYR